MSLGWLLDGAERERWLVALARHGSGSHRAVSLLGAIAIGGGLYGLACGSWRGGIFALYVAIKLPLVLLLTVVLTAAFQWVAAASLGLRLRPRVVLGASLGALAVAAVVLGSLAPVAWLFTGSAPEPSPGARTAHNLLYLLHTAMVGGAGLVGTVALRRSLCALGASGAVAIRVLVAWVLAFAFVGGEVAWLLRPFVGSVYQPVVFVRRDSFDRNVYEFIWNDIFPWLAGPGLRPGR